MNKLLQRFAGKYNEGSQQDTQANSKQTDTTFQKLSGKYQENYLS